MNKRTKIILILVIVFFILGMALFPTIKLYFSGGSDPEKESGNVPVPSRVNRSLNINAQVLRYERLDDIFRTYGVLVPDEEVDLSFETSGKIVTIYFQEGSAVKKGDLLAKVNDGPLQAELKILETQIPLAEDRVFRQKSLLEKDAVSQEAYEQVRTNLDKLNADIALVKSRIIQTELRAPFDGIIGLRTVSEGAYASPTTVIAKLTKIVPLKLEFSINESLSDLVRKGTNLDFYVGDNKYEASVYAVESTLDRVTLTLKARAIYPNPGGRLQPGRSAMVEIKLNEMDNALTVPSEAIIAEMGRDIAYLYKNGKAQLISLKKGMRTENKVQVLSGVQEGDTLITTGVMQLRDGMSVTIENLSN